MSADELNKHIKSRVEFKISKQSFTSERKLSLTCFTSKPLCGDDTGIIQVINFQPGTRIMNYNKRIFETIIEVLRRANIGFSINEVKDIQAVTKCERTEKIREKKERKES
jgi:hypothetical protein